MPKIFTVFLQFLPATVIISIRELSLSESRRCFSGSCWLAALQ